MDYDPAWDMPQPNWVQQGSFESGEIPPAVDPTAGTQICIGPLAQEWLPVILGALDQLRNPSTWIVADDAAMDQTLRRVDLLREIVATSEGCQLPVMMRLESDCILQYSNDGGATWIDVADWDPNFGICVRKAAPPPVPPNPGDDRIQLHACNIAGYIANQFIQVTMNKVVDYVGTSGEQLQFGQAVISTLAGDFPLTSGAYTAFHNFYTAVTTQLLTQVETVRDDASLWAAVTCAIYSAIRTVGYVDATNFSTAGANIGAISYPYIWVAPALHNYWFDLGLEQIQYMQAIGAIDVVDCSGCSTPICVSTDFTQGSGGWTAEAGAGAYLNSYAGFAWYQQVVSGSRIALRMSSPHFPTSAKITAVRITLSAPSGLTVTGARDVASQDVCNVHNVDVVNWTTSSLAAGTVVTIPISPGANVQCVKVDFDSDNTASPSGYITRIDLIGTGVNPVGPDNCTP